jgi:hypothetical protein
MQLCITLGRRDPMIQPMVQCQHNEAEHWRNIRCWYRPMFSSECAESFGWIRMEIESMIGQLLPQTLSILNMQ